MDNEQEYTRDNLPEKFNQKILAKYLGKSIAWCERARWAGKGKGPKFRKVGRSVVYTKKATIEWEDGNEFNSTSEYSA